MEWADVAYYGIIGALCAGAEFFSERKARRKEQAEPPDTWHEEEFYDAEEGEEVCDGEEAEGREGREVIPVVAILLAELDAVRAELDAVREERDRLRSQLAAKELPSGTKRDRPAQDPEEEPASELQAAKKRRTGGEEFFSAPPIQPKVEVKEPSPATSRVAREAPSAEPAQRSFIFKSKENVLPAAVELENPFLVKEEMAKVPDFVGTAGPWCENRENVENEANKISDSHVEDTSLALVSVGKNSAPPPFSFDDDPFFPGEYAEGYGGKQSGASFEDDPFFQGGFSGYGEGQYAASFEDDPYYEGDYWKGEDTDSFDDDPFYEGGHTEEEQDTDSFDDDPFYEGDRAKEED